VTPERRLRIMVVDDESLIAMALHDQLEYLGHEVVATASAGPEALALAELHEPDLVLMDIHLGGMDGLEASARINALRPTAIIILTGFPDKSLVERGRECGVVAHLLKPIDIEDLREAVDTGWLMFERSQRAF
jgi:two-component system, response regulator PdtaR